MRLHFVADARTEREVLAQTDVVLDVKGRLHVVVVDRRIAKTPRVIQRSSRFERCWTVEQKRAEVIRFVVGKIRTAVDADAGSDGLDSAHVIEIGFNPISITCAESNPSEPASASTAVRIFPTTNLITSAR